MKILKTYTYDEIEFLFKILKIKTLPYGSGIPLNSMRMKLFMKSQKCVHCGKTGSIFRLEIDNGGNYQFNLYHVDRHGSTMMTRDHITPRSRGGKNTLANSQVLCYNCNQKREIVWKVN